MGEDRLLEDNKENIPWFAVVIGCIFLMAIIIFLSIIFSHIMVKSDHYEMRKKEEIHEKCVILFDKPFFWKNGNGDNLREECIENRKELKKLRNKITVKKLERLLGE